jgi:hypothetical protein
MRTRQRCELALLILVGSCATTGLASLRAGHARAATPADGLVGQRVIACTYGKDLAVTVTGVDWTAVVADGLAPEGAMWLVARLDVTNLSDISEALTSRPLQLQDARGAVYPVQEDPPDATLVAQLYSVYPPWQEFEPGVLTPSVVTFLVPADVGGLTLVGRRDYCS